MEEMVSVPYRGILFFNDKEKEGKTNDKCFRPLSGNLIFQFVNHL